MKSAANVEPRPRASFYYGWIVVAIAALGMVATLPGRTQGLGLITVPILRDLHLTEVTYASVNLWATLIGALFCLGVGRLIDRHGARIVMTVVVVALGLVVIWTSRIRGGTGLFITTTLTRGFGQSALSVVSLAIVGKWFVRRLPQAMGLYAVLTVFGFVAAFPGVQFAVDRFGWRGVWACMGAVLLLVVAPIGAIWLRSTPEDFGLAVDPLPQTVVPSERADFGLTLSQALASPAFWAFAIASAAYNFVSSGTSLFNQSILDELHFGTDTFRLLLGATTLSGLAANLLGGWLAEKWPLGRLMGIAMLLQAVALGALPEARSRTHILAYAIATGVAGGIVTVIFFAFWGKVYGRPYLGKIQGAAQLLTVVGSGLGQQLFAEAHMAYHSYGPLFHMLCTVTAAMGILCWIVPMPGRSSAEVTGQARRSS